MTWYNQEGTKALETDTNVPYGTQPDFGSDEPVKADDAQYTYTFEGWAASANQETGTKEENLPTVSGPTEYWAAFSKTLRSYEVTFNMNGHGDAIEAQTIEYNKTATEPTAPTADHYEFGGWYTDANCTEEYVFSTPVTDAVTLYAKWTPKQYTVTFEAGEGSGTMDPQTFTYGVSQALTANSFTAPTGKVFDGWKDEDDNTYSNQQSISLTGNIKLTAQWAFNPYTVNSDQTVQNGTVGVNKNSANYGDIITVTVTPAEGYKIVKVIYTPEGGIEQTIDPVDGTYSFTMPASNVTVSATFKAIDYTVTIDEDITNGGVEATIGDGKTAANIGDTVTLKATPNAGYKLKDYTVTYTYTDEQGETQTGTVTVSEDDTFTMPPYNVTVSATFEGVGYTIAYNNNGGTGSMNNTSAVYGTPVALSANVFNRDGYSFKGWATTAGGTVRYTDKAEVSNLTTIENETVTLYAVWEANTYTVTLNAQGGKVNDKDTDTISVTYNSAYGDKLVDAAREGYTFDGWYMEEAYTNKVEATTTVTTADDHTLYAKWTPNQYTVTLDHNYEGSTNGSITVIYDSTYSGLTNPTRPGYAFDGWYDAKTDGNKVNSTDTVKITTDTTLYAHWTANPYTITFDLNGGEWPTGVDYSAGMSYTIESPDKLPTAEKANYTFTGWLAKYEEGVDQNWCVAAENGEIKDTAYNAGTAVTGYYGNITMVAQWDIGFTYSVESYKYAKTGYMMLRIATDDNTNAYSFGGETMYYTDNADYKLTITKEDKTTETKNVFVTLIPTKDGETELVTSDNKLTETAMAKITQTNGSATVIARDGDVNGDEVVNIADANVVYQMVEHGGSYYGNLEKGDHTDILSRLEADVDTLTENVEARGSLEDVDWIVNIINGVSNTTN